eukprot:TRINITY_DN10540_c0_g2_i1.p1 TRINITY_DN10540_c0_g2~~TRINITY_DN10540_c0_g2_i1.p1  ORF type:complete len:554 (+),score=158.80 TRINITY_DN10540_c0_g2_i1:82-1662(+)
MGDPSAGGWSCPRCTFINPAGAAECEMCGGAPPAAPAPATPAAAGPGAGGEPAPKRPRRDGGPVPAGGAAAAAGTAAGLLPPGKQRLPGGGLWFTGDGFLLNAPPGQEGLRHAVSFAELLRGPRGERPKALLLSTFQLEPEFLRRELPRDVPVTIVRHWAVGEEAPGQRQLGESWLIHHPPLERFQTMHTKLLLAVFQSSIRVGVTSANLTYGDWHAITQCLWVQDFCRRGSPPPAHCPAPAAGSGGPNTFQRDLGAVLSSFGPGAIGPAFLQDYDFSPAKGQLVISRPGRWAPGSAAEGHGFLRLRALLRERGLLHSRWPVHFLVSSVGQVTRKWYSEVSGALSRPDWSAKTAASAVGPNDFPLHVVYPSAATVQRSEASRRGGGVICLSTRAYSAPSFPKGMLRDYLGVSPVQGESVSHAKLMMQWPADAAEQDFGNFRGWVMVGSHNFSASALGRLQGDGGLQLSNYELSVLLPPTAAAAACDALAIERAAAGDAPAPYPLPCLLPAPEYEEGQRPWLDFGQG